MKASLIIPVWNGASVIGDCLQAIFAQSDDNLLEVICVDNASADASANIIETDFPQVHLIHQPVNLGFAGGVNAGIQAARGDTFILLNQDCIPEQGWLSALNRALEQNPSVGILGCTILNPDGSLNHTGAVIHRPDAIGQHLKDIGDGQVKLVEFVTGAAVAVRRSTCDRIGVFDDGFYPAYYEDTDFCYRARTHRIETAWDPDARVRHLFSNRDWQLDPIKHTTNGYLSRYRFVSKHFNHEEIAGFFKFELESLKQVGYLDHAVGRVIAAKQTLPRINEILERRLLDLGEEPSPVFRRQLQAGFSEIARQAFIRARSMVSSSNTPASDVTGFPSEDQKPFEPENQFGLQKHSSRFSQKLAELNQHESDILAHSIFRPSNDLAGEPFFTRLLISLKRFIVRLTTGGELFRIYHLDMIHASQVRLLVEKIDQQDEIIDKQEEKIAAVEKGVNQAIIQNRQLEETQKLLEILTEYEYR